MIEVEALTKTLRRFTAVSNLSFSVRPGEVLGLVGPNGAGKTSTLRCLAGIIPANSGTVRIAGHSLESEPVEAKRQLAFFRTSRGCLNTSPSASISRSSPGSTASPVMRTFPRACSRSWSSPRRPTSCAAELSRGMKQKLVIACGLLHSPKVMFFDEPLTGLDPLGIRRMKDSIVRRARDGAAIVLSSHLLHLLQEVCTHVLILKKGTKVADGTLSDVEAQFSNGEAGVSLEEIFIRATGGSET